jgi:hypothetical protein
MHDLRKRISKKGYEQRSGMHLGGLNNCLAAIIANMMDIRGFLNNT